MTKRTSRAWGVAVPVLAGFLAIQAAESVDVRAAFEALVVPASFVAAGLVGIWLRASRAVTILLVAVGLLHVGALVVSAGVLGLEPGGLTSLLNVVSQVLYGLGFAALVLLAAVYPRRRLVASPITIAPLVLAVVLPLVGGLAGATPTVLQPATGARTVPAIAEVLPEGLAATGALILALPLVSAVLFGWRYRRAGAEARRRMRWPMLGVGLIALLAITSVLLDSSLPPFAEAVFLVAAPLLPLSIVAGSAASPPWDVDVLARRSAVFGGTWAMAAAAYGIGISASAWAAGGRGLAAAVVLGGVLSLMLATPVRHRLVSLADERQQLQADLAAQVRLLTRRSAELDDSRRRLAAATEIERLRIERDLHDGVQQEILAVVAQIEAARIGLRQVQVPPGAARALEQASALARSAYQTVRAVSAGIRPPALEDLGLVNAIASRAASSPVPVQVVAAEELSALRWPAEVEGAAYFFVQEGLANVLKHSSASQAVTEIAYQPGRLIVEVRDNGRGGLDPAAGTGLTGLRDRLEAFGGSLVAEEAGGWTRVRAMLPALAVTG